MTTIISMPDWLFQAFIEFGAAFSGVFLAFWLDRHIRRRRDRETRKKLKESLKSELESCVQLLVGKGNRLPTTMWSSTISSGDQRLLTFEERHQLSVIYFEIENHNYEAKRVRDGAVIAQTGPRTSIRAGKTAARSYWKGLSRRLEKKEEGLKQKILELLKATWW